ncbi:hypothetical protein LAZ67_21002703, partial [Cordylochernes scorpioides]
MFSHVTRRSETVPPRIQPPETFDFSTPNEWPKWRKRFERYLVVSGMKKKEEANKIDLFMYLMGDRADDIFRTFKFEKEEEATKIDSVLKAFDSHFCVRKNIIYERAKFNSRIQEDREPVDEFITSLYKLADSCEFEGLHEQLIRDRIVVGVRDKALSERMQLDSELTLEKAVKLVRQQQVDLQRPSTSQKVNQVKFNSKKQSPKQQQQPSRKKEKSAKTRSRCPKCGGFTHKEGQACRAEGQICNLCSKTGHFANCCPDKQAKTAEVKAVSELDEEIGFLLEVSAVEDSSNLDDDEGECWRRWTAEIQVNGKQKVMSIILQGMDGVMCCLDDILIFASDSKTHDRILRLVLRKLKEAKVTLNKAKCVFGVPRINFLGHILVEDGIRPDPAKIEAVAKMLAPTDVHGVRRFLGMVNHLGRFVENLSEIVAPLNQLLVKGQDFVWDCSQERAFRKLKELLTTQPILAAYDVRKPTMVSSYASSYGLGAVLKQEGKNGIWRPVAYSSRTMTPTEKRYAQIEKEALAITWACERFQDFLLGKSFRIETDHKPLIPLFSTATFPNAYDEVWIRNSAYPWKGAARRRCIIQTTTSYNRGRYPLHTDASGHGIGAVLLQIQGGKERPIAYASRSLTKAENNYSTTEKECLAVVWSISKFRPYLFGRPITVVTDHHSLCWLVGQKDPSGRLARWALKLQEFDVTVIYKSGRTHKHKDADCLSRSPLENDQPSAVMSLTNVDIEQTKDPDLAKIIDNLNSGYTRKEFSIIDGILYKKNYSTTARPWLMMIPKHLRSGVMADLHDAPTAGHSGFARTYDKVKKRFYWPGLYRTVRQYVSHCRECQRRKKLPRRPAGQLVSIPPVEKPFYKVGVDLLGRFPVSKDGNHWIIVCTDYMTRIVHRFTMAYHPQTNGLTERFNKTLADMLSMYTGVEQKDWDQVLPYVTFAYNTAKQEVTGNTPFFLVHAREAETYIDAVLPYLPDEISDDYVGELVTRAEEARQLSRSRLLQSQAKDRRLYHQKHTPVYYQKDDLVWVFTPIRKVGLSEKLLKRYFGPYKVTKKLSEVTNFNLQTQNLTPQQKLQKLPQYLVKQPLDLFRQLRLDAKPYEEAQRTLEDLFPDKTDTTYAKFFAAKAQHYNTLEEYFRTKTTLGMQLNLPRPVIIEALTEGLPTGDQRLVRVVPPKSLSEWYELTSRVRGNFSPQPPRGPDNPPRMEGPYHNTPRPPPRAQNYAAIPPSPCKFCQGQHWHSQCQQRPASNAQHGQTYHASHHRQGTFNQANNGRQPTPSTVPAAPTTSNTSPKQPDIHPLPLIESVLDKLSRAKIFSSVDIASAYWQIEIAPESRPLLAFVTPDGQYQWTRLPFGLRNSPQIYERSISAINVYNKFIPNYARLRTPLNNLLKKNVNWHWSDACQQAFETLKKCLTTQPILHLFQEGLPCQLYCDASTQGIAGILKQVHPNNQIHPVQFYSRALRPHEQNYNISELECLAIIESVEKFRIYLTGTKFTIFSDHHALQWLKSIKNPAGRLFRWSLRLSTYDYEIRYIKGTQQYEADLLSRNPFCGFLDADTIKIHQNNTPTHPHITQDTNGLHTITRKGVAKILIPEKLRNTLLNKVHLEYNHPGISQMSRLVSGQYHWSGMSRDIKNHVNSCTTCQLTKHPKEPTYGELGQTPSATKPFDLLSINTVSGFAKYGNSKTHLHVIVDHMTRYAWTFPSKSTSTLTYIQAIKKVLVYGSPKRLLSDRAPAFTSEKFRRFLIAHGIQPLNTTSNNPQANGLCERLNSTITGKLRLLHLENPKTSWTKLVNKVTQVYNNTPHSVTGFPPSYLLFGIIPTELSNHINPYPPIDIARQQAYQHTQLKHDKDKQKFDLNHKTPNFEIGDLVLVKVYHHPNTGKLTPYFTGPYTILEVISPNVVKINRPNQPLNKEHDTIHVNKLRPYTESVPHIAPPT